MKQYMIHLEVEELKNDDTKHEKKVFIINQYQKEKIDKIIEESKEDNSSINK